MSKAALALIITSVLAGSPELLVRGNYDNRTPKDNNKHKLTDEEIELLSTMTPKEKKQFFKNRKALNAKE